jgi:uncharacterized membrane protein
MEPQPPRRHGLFGGLRSSFLTGLVVVLPIGLTIYLIWTVIGWLDGWILPLIPAYYQPDAMVHRWFGPDADYPVRGLGVMVFLIFTVLIGWIAKGLIGRSVLRQAERLVDRMPVVRSVYTGFKQIAETVFGRSETHFDKTCLVQFPREGVWALGFVASKAKGEIALKLPGVDHLPGAEGHIAVFVALTPFTSGLLIYVPATEVILLDMTSEDAAKMIVSAGLVNPAPKLPAL